MPELDFLNQKSCVVLGGECPLEQLEWEFRLNLAAQQLKRVDIPSLALHVVEQVEMADEKLSARLFLVLSELVSNALDHGLLKLDSALKHSREGIEHYFGERAARLERLEQGEIRLRLCKLSGAGRQCLRIDVRDSGDGFNHAEILAVADETVSQRRHGRGIALVKHMSGAISYNATGSEVRVCLPVGGGECSYPENRI